MNPLNLFLEVFEETSFGLYGKKRYGYGFNGIEKTDEISGTGNHYSAQFWEMDPRLGRRWERDPVVKMHESPYAILGNNPIWFVDLNWKIR
ncbi:MAG: hypothetical protein K2X86_17585 [Cytophagaceae bacterium]|nr:hypothetical protein [Cytophagaceae bacterium]